MDYFLRTVLPKRLSMVTKVRIDEPVLILATTGSANFTHRIRQMLDKMTGLKELSFKRGIPYPEELSRECGIQLEKNGVVVTSGW